MNFFIKTNFMLYLFLTKNQLNYETFCGFFFKSNDCHFGIIIHCTAERLISRTHFCNNNHYSFKWQVFSCCCFLCQILIFPVSHSKYSYFSGLQLIRHTVLSTYVYSFVWVNEFLAAHLKVHILKLWIFQNMTNY